MKLKILVGATLFCMLPSLSLAGATFSKGLRFVSSADGTEVTITGSLQGARLSPDSEQYVECGLSSGVDSETSSASVGVVCRARDSRGNNYHCDTQNQAFIKVVGALSHSSSLQLKIDLQSGICTRLWVNNASYNL